MSIDLRSVSLHQLHRIMHGSSDVIFLFQCTSESLQSHDPRRGSNNLDEPEVIRTLSHLLTILSEISWARFSRLTSLSAGHDRWRWATLYFTVYKSLTILDGDQKLDQTPLTLRVTHCVKYTVVDDVSVEGLRYQLIVTESSEQGPGRVWLVWGFKSWGKSERREVIDGNRPGQTQERQRESCRMKVSHDPSICRLALDGRGVWFVSCGM